MDIHVVRLAVTPETLEAYATVSAESTTDVRLNLAALLDPAGPLFIEERLAQPRILDSDLNEPPQDWARRDDLDRWVMLCALDGVERAGGAIVALRPGDHWFFPPATELAVLWDIRVKERYRRLGVARRLLLDAAACAVEAGCRVLAIETQDVNVGACRLYASAGAVLRDVRRGAYRDHQDEAALLWFLERR